MLKWLLKLWLDESGQVGETQDASDADGSPDAEGSVEEEAGTDDVKEQTDGDEGEESFVDPESVPEDILNTPQFKGMQRAYNKKMLRLREGEQKLQTVERLENDPAFARQFVQLAAQKLGLQVQAPEGGASGQSNGDIVSAVKSALPPEYVEAIPGLADAISKAVETATTPIKQQFSQATQESQQRLQKQEWERAAEALSNTDPEWEEFADDIGDLNEFLKGSDLHHPVWGNKLTLLHKMVRGDEFATSQAIDRMRGAVKNKTQTGANKGGQFSLSDIQDQIAKADSRDDKWSKAFEFARNQLKRNGGRA